MVTGGTNQNNDHYAAYSSNNISIAFHCFLLIIQLKCFLQRNKSTYSPAAVMSRNTSLIAAAYTMNNQNPNYPPCPMRRSTQRQLPEHIQTLYATYRKPGIGRTSKPGGGRKQNRVIPGLPTVKQNMENRKQRYATQTPPPCNWHLQINHKVCF